MVARVKVAAGVPARFDLHSVIEKPLCRNSAGRIALFTEFVVAPDEAAERSLHAVGQMANAMQPAHAVVSELGARVRSIHRNQSILRVPLVRARPARRGARVELVQRVVSGHVIRYAVVLGETVAEWVVNVGKRIHERARVRD